MICKLRNKLAFVALIVDTEVSANVMEKLISAERRVVKNTNLYSCRIAY